MVNSALARKARDSPVQQQPLKWLVSSTRRAGKLPHHRLVRQDRSTSLGFAFVSTYSPNWFSDYLTPFNRFFKGFCFFFSISLYFYITFLSTGSTSPSFTSIQDCPLLALYTVRFSIPSFKHFSLCHPRNSESIVLCSRLTFVCIPPSLPQSINTPTSDFYGTLLGTRPTLCILKSKINTQTHSCPCPQSLPFIP